MPESTELPILLRAHTVLPSGLKRRKRRRGARPWAGSDCSLVVTCVDDLDEPIPGVLGSYRVVQLGELIDAGVIWEDGATSQELADVRSSLDGSAAPSAIRDEAPRLVSRVEFIRKVLLPAAFELNAVTVGFNLPSNLSRLSVKWSVARKEPFRGGFSFVFRHYVDKQGKLRGDAHTPRIAVKAIDSKRSLIGFTSAWRKQPQNGKRRKRGSWLDLRALGFALTGDDMTVEEACRKFDVVPTGILGGDDLHSRVATLLGRTKTIGKLHENMMYLYSRIDPPLPPQEAFSAASIGKATLRKMGVTVPRLRVEENLRLTPDQVSGWAMTSYFGGRAECRVRRVLLPVAYCDFRSMYATVFTLMGLDDLLTAKEIVAVDATEEVRRLLETVEPQVLFNPNLWKEMAVLVELQPERDVLPVRARFTKEGKGSPSIAVTYVTSPYPLVFTLADCIGSKLLTGKAPRVLRAIRFVPEGVQALRPVRLCGLPPLDTSRGGLFRWLVEARYRIGSLTTVPPQIADLQKVTLKGVATSTGYGVFIELNRQENSPAKVEVYGLDTFTSTVENPEEPGPYYLPVIGALITGGARLLLALLEHEVTIRGGTYCFIDTDSMAIVSTVEGGLVPCPGGPRKLEDGSPAIYALSKTEVAEIIDKLRDLNPYDQELVPGSILELEEENFKEEGQEGDDPQLRCYAVVAKRYTLFNLQDGRVRIRKGSEHTLGSYLPPVDPEIKEPIREWIERCWEIVVEMELGIRHGVMPTWHQQLALRALRISRPAMMKWFEAAGEGARPYGLFEHALLAPLYSPPAVEGRPVCLIRPASASLSVAGRWIDLHDPKGPTYRVVTGERQNQDRTTLVGETYGDLIEQHPLRPEPKSLDSMGNPCSRHSRGLLQRRHVQVTGIKYVGKEANELELIEAGLITDQDEFLTEYSRDIRDFLPEILRLIPAKLVENALNCSRRFAFALRSGERKPSKRRLPQVIRLAGQFGREYLANNGELDIPAEDELAIYRMINWEHTHNGQASDQGE